MANTGADNRQTMTTFFRRVTRFVRLLMLLLHAVLKTILFKHQVKDGIPEQAYFNRAQVFLENMCRIVGLELIVEGELPDDKTGLLVANHVSWLDIPVVGSIIPSLFLSKAEVRKWPLIGWIASKNGTLFIARGKQGAASQANADLTYALNNNVNVLLFPEGTTNDGTHLRNFHPRLYAAAIETERPVIPITLRYEAGDGSLHEDVPFIDDQTFIANLWKVLGNEKVIVKVNVLKPIQAANTARKVLATDSREAVHKALQLGDTKA